jgi:hypothetical protein
MIEIERTVTIHRPVDEVWSCQLGRVSAISLVLMSVAER